MEKKKKRKIVKHRKPFNIAILFFGAIFVYLLIPVYVLLTSEHISGYEVIAGSLATNKQFQGLALRTEEVYQASTAGYLDYYSVEGAKVSNATIVYSVDESGRMSEYLQENLDDITLSAEHYGALKADLSAFGNGYKPADFSDVYHFHDKINGEILEMNNHILLTQMKNAADKQDVTFQRVYAQKSGIVVYNVDGLEAVTAETFTPEMFDKSNYQCQNLRDRDIISSGDPAYKLVTDENWSLIVPMTAEQIDEIAFEYDTDKEDEISKKQKEVIEVEFLKDHTTSWAYISILNMHGQQYLKLDFNNSMVRFAADRFLDIQFLVDDTKGLKIPSSAITTKEFFVVPEEYVVIAGEHDKEGVAIETFDEKGERHALHVTPTFYAKVDGMVYIDPNQGSFASNEPYIKEGDRLIVEGKTEVYTVSRREKLQGVYCINQGYTLFRKIKPLHANEEYTIIEEGTPFGLVIYDRIVLNADAVKEEQVIY